MSNLEKDREELVELFGVFFESTHLLPPLGARILANLIVDSRGNHITFDELVERMGASKSSVSTNLNLLVKLGKITYFTLPGDRKKYYKPTPFSDRFDNYLKMIALEKVLVEKMTAYRDKSLCPKSKSDIEMVKVYNEHLNEMERLILKSVNDFKEIEKNNPI
jgi:DNA-binding transcriptional regulator GbsR (MarR family)